MENFQMYSQIQQMKKKGFRRGAIGRQLKLNWRTVDHYWDMTAEDYEAQRTRQSSSGLDSRKDIILLWLRNHEDVSAVDIPVRRSRGSGQWRTTVPEPQDHPSGHESQFIRRLISF